MKIIKHIDEMKNLSLTLQKAGKTVSFVPTMGALHDGHISLLKIAKQKADKAIMSIFVNPTQFGPKEDFSKYPRPFEQDCEIAEKNGCDFMFAPISEEMYPPHYNTYVSVEEITRTLCGISRPNHFRGVTTVVLKLFNIVNPQVAIFGQKDAQQVIVIKRMVQDLNLSVRIETGATIREKDGLAMSSRNKYLTSEERKAAPVIYNGLQTALELFTKGEKDTQIIRDKISQLYLASQLITPEYIEIVNMTTLQSLDQVEAPCLMAVACRTGQSGTRLIDNIVLGGSL